MTTPSLNGTRPAMQDDSGQMRPPEKSTVNNDTVRSKIAPTPKTLGPRVA